MSGFLKRVAERALGRADALRPAANRYLIAVRDDDAGGMPAVENGPAPASGGAEYGDSPLRSERYDRPVRTDAPERIGATSGAVPAPDVQQQTPVPGAATAAPLRLVPWLTAPESASHHPERAQPQSEPAPMRTETRLLPLERSAASGAPAGIERVPSATAAEPPAVHVHIGRIDIRAIDAPPAKPTPERTGPRGPSLAEHLRARERNVR